MVKFKQLAKHLPLVASVRQTETVWQDFDTRQKTHAIAASTATLGRLGFRIALENAVDNEQIGRGKALVFHSIIDMADNIDGRIARAGDAVTPWGKEIDPLADKADFFIEELRRVRRGEMGLTELTLRVVRDILSTYFRLLETERVENGSVAVSHAGATWAGKASSFIRAVSLRINDIAPNSRAAVITRHAATAALVGSLGMNAYNYFHNPPEEV